MFLPPAICFLKEYSHTAGGKVIGIIIAVIIIVVIAVVIGIVVGRQNSKKKSTDKNAVAGDPSVFSKDSNLHQSFYGLAYTPAGSQLPDCGNNLGQSPLHPSD
jgi:hypothetical protein